MEEENKRGLKIGDNYILRADSLNLILEEYGYKNPSPKDAKKAKEEGIVLEQSWGLVRTTYHGNLKQVLNHILDNNIITDVKEDIKELTEIVQVVEKLRSEFEKFKSCTELVQESLKVIK